MQHDFLSQTTLFIVAISPLLGFVFSNSASVFLIFPNKIKLIKRLLSHRRIAWSSESILSITVGIRDRDDYMLHQTELMAELHQELKWHFDCNKRSTVSDLASAEHCVKRMLYHWERDTEKDKYRDYYGQSSCSLQWEQCFFQSLLAYLISFFPALVNGRNGLTLF